MNHNQNLSEPDNISQSPCIRNCCLNEEDTCLGCFRSLDEITQWNEADNHARHIIVQKSRQRQEAYYLKYGNY
jgi:predicted Fe-S protein YdhL (DUF1289 family)